MTRHLISSQSVIAMFYLLSVKPFLTEIISPEVMENEVKGTVSQENISWRQELEYQQSQAESVQEKVVELRVSIQSSETDAKKELNLLWCRLKATATLLAYLKTNARLMLVPNLSFISSGIKYQEGIGLIDKHGIPLSDWSKDVDLSSFETSDEEALFRVFGSIYENDRAYVGKISKSVQMVSDAMEALIKRVILAETEATSEKQKVSLGQEEIARKTLQIENMSAEIEGMFKFAMDANVVLNKMRQKVKELIEETCRQRQLAAENEQELCRVKQDFESLRSYVRSLISVRETLLASRKQFQTMEKLFDRLMDRSVHLENEKAQKEAEVQKLMQDNVTLRAMLDEKEANLLAMNEQCKFMALNGSGI